MADTSEHNTGLETWEPVREERLDLVQCVVEQLREKILNGAFEPAGFLPAESALARHLLVSRPVVREAMRVLSAQGLVEVSQGRRARVLPADPRASADTLNCLFARSKMSALDLIELRRVLEVEIAALAAERATEEDLRALEQVTETLKAAKASGKLEPAVEADVAFHQRLAQATGNRAFALLMQTMSSLLLDSVRRTASRCPPDVHQPVLEAVRRHDVQKARKAMYWHIWETERLLLESENSIDVQE
jgi:GntR family transcriptional repressor for pyruvate dehydrogenase complex